MLRKMKFEESNLVPVAEYQIDEDGLLMKKLCSFLFDLLIEEIMK